MTLSEIALVLSRCRVCTLICSLVVVVGQNSSLRKETMILAEDLVSVRLRLFLFFV